MYQYLNAFTNRSGDALPGYFARLFDTGGNLVDLFADNNGTPIATVSGVANAALSDSNGMFRWFVANGTYDMRFYDANDVFVSVETGVPMVEASQVLVDLSGDDGATLVGTPTGTVQDDIDARPTTAVLAASTGGEMVGFQQAGAGASEQTMASAVSRIQVSLEDYGGGTGIADNTTALRNAAAALNTAGGGTLRFGPGTYNFASATLAGTGVELPGNIEVVGRGKGVTTLNVTGTTSCYFFLNETNQSNQRLDGFTFHGNSQASGVGPGGFYYCTVLSGTATADVENVVLTNVRLENCKADYWIRFYCSSGAYSIMRCGIGAGCEAQSYAGNSRDPTNLGVNSAIIEFNGDSAGFIYDPFVEGMWADLTYVKSGIICFSNVVRAKIVKPTLLDAFQGYANPDKGGYAIMCYDSTGIVTDAIIDTPTITAPFSCGIYAAGTNGLRILNPKISGQNDTSAGTLPKAALSINGAVNCTVENPKLSDNFCDIRYIGPVENVGSYFYPAQVNFTVSGGYARDCTEDSVIINSSPFHQEISGIRFQGFKVIGSTGRGALIQGNATYGFNGIDFTSCEIGAGTYGYAINPSGIANHKAKNIRLSEGTIEAGTAAINSLNPSSTSGLYVRGVKFYGTPSYFISINGTKLGELRNNQFIGTSSGAAVELDDCTIEFAGNTNPGNTTTLVYNGTNSLGRTKPTFSSFAGHVVQNAIAGLTGTTPNAYRLTSWTCQGSTTWADDKTGLQ